MPGGLIVCIWGTGERLRFSLFLIISSMHTERAIKICCFNVQRFVFGPLIKADFLYQTEIEKLGVVWSDRCPVGIGMKMIAGKISALMTVGNVFLDRAAEYSARLVVSQERNCSFRIPASFTSCLL
jgi:hypothetical protein